MTDPDALTAPLLQRIEALEQALQEARAAAKRNEARAVMAEHQLPPSPAAAPPADSGRRGWRARRVPTSGYEGLGQRVEQLLRLAQEQAADILAAAHREAEDLRAAAVADAAALRSAAVPSSTGQGQPPDTGSG